MGCWWRGVIWFLDGRKGDFLACTWPETFFQVFFPFFFQFFFQFSALCLNGDSQFNQWKWRDFTEIPKERALVLKANTYCRCFMNIGFTPADQISPARDLSNNSGQYWCLIMSNTFWLCLQQLLTLTLGNQITSLLMCRDLWCSYIFPFSQCNCSYFTGVFFFYFQM